jgi:two-component system sensor histidine kinase KdpD
MEEPMAERAFAGGWGASPNWIGFAGGAVVVVPATVLSRLLFSGTQLADVVMVYLLGIVLVSLRWGLGPSLLTSVLSVLAVDFFFVPPIHTFAVSDVNHFVTFAVMFLVGVVISGLNKRVRDQAEATRERDEKAHEAQLRIEAEQLRNSLLSSLSHDLRTPLAVITGAASTLLEAKIDASMRRDLTETILSEAELLNRLVRNVLDMTRLEAGAVEVKKEWQALEEDVGAARGRVDGVLGPRKVTTDLPASLPLMPYDSILLQQVLVNLLENAAKYTPTDARIAISARIEPAAVEICVADNGPGLPCGEEAKVFTKFYRTAGGPGRGVGLGLTICKAIVTAHGGRIWAERGEDGGAAFRFTLPIEGTPPTMVEERAS